MEKRLKKQMVRDERIFQTGGQYDPNMQTPSGERKIWPPNLEAGGYYGSPNTPWPEMPPLDLLMQILNSIRKPSATTRTPGETVAPAMAPR